MADSRFDDLLDTCEAAITVLKTLSFIVGAGLFVLPALWAANSYEDGNADHMTMTRTFYFCLIGMIGGFAGLGVFNRYDASFDTDERNAVPTVDPEREQQQQLLEDEENVYQKQLEAAGYTYNELVHHAKLSRFIDPVSREITRHPVLTNTGNIMDKAMANRAIQYNLRLFTAQRIQSYTEPQELQQELESAVKDAVQQKKSFGM